MSEMFICANFGKKYASYAKLGSYNGPLRTEHNDARFATISQILRETGEFVIHDSKFG